MNTTTMKYVVAVADERSFTKASKLLMVSQPTLSLNIINLEKKLGIPIFNRSTYPITLTSAGRIYVEWAREAILAEEKMLEQIQKQAAAGDNVIRVATSPHRARALMPDLVKRFHDEFPEYVIQIIETNLADIYQLLDEGRADLALSATNEQDAVEYRIYDLQKEIFLLAAPKSFRITGAPGEGRYPVVMPEQLREYPFVMLEKPSFVGRLMDNLSKAGNFVPIVSAICTRVESAYTLVCREIGASLIPHFYVEKCDQPTDNVDFFQIYGLENACNLSMLHAKDLQLTPALSCLIRLTRELYGETAAAL